MYGGPVRSISALCEGLVSLGVDVSVMTTNANGRDRLDVPINQTINVNGVNVIYFPVTYNGYCYSSELSQAIQNSIFSYDIVEVQSLWAHPLIPTARSCIKNNIPYVVPLHGQLLPWSINHKHLKKYLYLQLIGKKYINSASAIHCTTIEETGNLSGLNISPPPFVVPNALEISKYQKLPERKTSRDSFNIKNDEIYLLYLGRLHHKKRPDIVFNTFVKAQERYRNIHLVFAGPDEGKYKNIFLDQACDLGLRNRIHFTGLLNGDEILNVLSGADILLMPSELQSENFGMAAVEAMAAGVPILISEGVPVGKDAEIAGAGRVVPCDARSFSEVAIEMLSDRDRLTQMGRAGQIHVRNKYDREIVANQMLAQFQAIIETGKPIT